jgi:rRNA maturation RNase YbeY
MPVNFQNADVRFSLKGKKKLKDFISRELKKVGIQKFTVDYIFCSDEYLLDINQKFLDHDYYTDIITFPLSKGGELEAEIYISIDRVKENSTSLKVAPRDSLSQSFENELNRVIFHGILHLLGHQDKTKAQKSLMRKLEDQWLVRSNS